MKLKALDWLVCPVCGGEFEVENANGHPSRPSEEVSRPLSCARCHAPKPERSTHSPAVCCSVCYAVEIESGRLVCTGGHAFEIREGVPRLRLDQKLDASHAPAQGDSLTVAASFSAEWSHFNYECDRTWHQGVQERCELFLKEVALPREELRGKALAGTRAVRSSIAPPARCIWAPRSAGFSPRAASSAA